MIKINKWRKILIKLLMIDQNETYILSDTGYSRFQNLVIEVAKAETDIRFCSNESCKCHPEYNILLIIKEPIMKDFLNGECPGIIEAMKTLCKNYIPHQNKLIDV